MKNYVTATFLNTKFNTTFEQGFGTYTEFENFLILNKQFVLLRVEYAK